MKTVRIGAGMGFYGDSWMPALQSARTGDVRYLSFDDLAELTLAILQKDRAKDPTKGYTRDITGTMQTLLPVAREKGIKLITNAGGINPEGARAEVMRVAKSLGLTGLKVGVATGDNIMDRLDELQGKGVSLKHYDTGEDINRVRDRLVFASVYLGASPIVEALRQGADVVVTGRTTDTAQFLAPLIYEFGWGPEDWDQLAAGVLLGHLMECSGQATGGNFSGRWWEVPELWNIGYPIAEVSENGEAILTKAPETGGLVSVDTIKEQLLYEIHDPSTYITPDVIADFSGVRLEDVGPDRVKVSGAKGRPAPPTLKAVMGYADGFMGIGMMGYSWPDALAKARRAEEIVRHQIEMFGIRTQEIVTEFLGLNSIHGPLAPLPEKEEPNEVYLRMAVRTDSREDAAKFGRLFAPLALNGPPFVGGLSGLSSIRELIGLWSTLVPREEIESHVHVDVAEVK